MKKYQEQSQKLAQKAMKELVKTDPKDATVFSSSFIIELWARMKRMDL